MTALPNNVTTVEDARLIGLAGLAFLGESESEAVAYVNDGNGNSISQYEDGSIWLCANVSEIYPSLGDYLAECEDESGFLTRQLLAIVED